MHLSDDELLEIDEPGKLHLAECGECRQRAKVLFELRNAISENIQAPVNAPPWSSLHQHLQAVQKEQRIKQVENRARFWRVSSFALAASLAVVVLWQGTFREDIKQLSGSEESQLIALIDTNKQLQQQVMLKNLGGVEFKALQMQLEVIDKALQQAYLQELSEEQKAALWQQRQLILKRSLANKKESKILRI